MVNPDTPVVNFVLGTAGHIDHGKTALIKALTGIDADRFREEKDRGMTIDIGYAHMVVDRTLNLGVIDVPGHERFVRNMVAGATGIGLVILVVAADDGVMPQTREHVEIMEILGVRHGLCAVTKIDIVDEEMVELVDEDVRDFVKGTFLEEAPIFHVSAHRGDGMGALRSHIEDQVRTLAGPTAQGVFRLPIQRSFSSRGQGTVVTGVAVSGGISLGDELQVLPSGDRTRIKGMEAYGKNIEHAQAGHRTALNLVGVDYHALHRGDVLAEPGYLSSSPVVTARFRLLSSAKRALKNQTSIHFHTGTFDTLGRIFLLSKKKLSPGEEDFVQFRLDTPVPAAPGDHYIARLASPALTIGGGMLLEVENRRRKPNRDWILQDLKELSRALRSPSEHVLFLLKRSGTVPLAPGEIARSAMLHRDEAESLLTSLGDRVRPVFRGEKRILGSIYDERVSALLSAVGAYHVARPLRVGLDKVALRNDLGLDRRLFDEILTALDEEEKVTVQGGRVALAGFTPRLGADEAERKDRLLAIFEEGGFSPPDEEEAVNRLGGDLKASGEILRHCLETGEVTDIGEGLLFHHAVLSRAEEIVRSEIQDKGELISRDFRDRVDTTRKYAIPMLEYFDRVGLTIRLDNKRLLREHGGKK